MKTRYKIIGASIGFGLLFWGVDAVLDYFFFYPGMSVIGLLITQAPSHEIYVRSVVLVGFILFGVLIATVVAKLEQTERRHARLNRVLRAIRNINQLIVREKDRDRLIQDVCDHLIESRGYHSAWIVLFDAAGEVMATAQSGLDESFAPLLAQLRRDELPACGQQALDQAEMVVIAEPATACTDCPLAANYEGALTVRLAHGEQVYGLLAVSIPVNLVGDIEEQALLREVAGDIAFALHDIELETARVGAEAELRESEEKYRTLLHNIQAGVVVHSDDARIVASNAKAQEMLGLTESQLVGKAAVDSSWRFLREDGTPMSEEEYPVNQVLRTGRPLRDFIFGVCRPRYEDVVWVLVYADPTFDTTGDLKEIIVTFMDITERKQAQAALRESERKYRMLVETIPYGIEEVDLEGRMVFLNDAHHRMLGYQPGELVGDYIWEHDPTPEHTEEIQAYFEYLKNEQPEPESYTSQNVCKDGEIIDVLVDWNYKRDEDGTLQGFISVVTDITERKEAEAALRESERRFRIVLENLPGGLFAHDLDGHLLLVNKMAVRNTGYAQEELLNLTVADIDPSSVTRDDRAHLWHQLDEGETRTLHSMHVRKDGSQYPAEVYLSNITLKGEPVILGVAMDITERKQAEEALRESEERFRLTFHTSPDAININRLEDGLYVDINEGFTQLTGYTRDDVIGKTSLDIDIWHDPADRQELVRGLREKEYYKNLEAEFQRKDGSVRTGLMSARIISLNGALHIISITRDISERKQMEEALRESESRLRAILKYTPAIIYLKDRQARFTLVNRAFEEAFNITRDEILGKTDDDLMPAEVAATYRQHDEQVMQRGQPLQVEETAIQSDGEQHVALSNKFPMYDAEGELSGVGGISIDITERKQMEEALRESEKKYRTLFESALNPIFMVDEHSRYIDANPAALEFLECDRETLLEKRVWDFTPPGFLERQQQEHAPFVGRRTLETDYFVHGEIKTLLLNVVPLKLKGETVLYGVGQDITERKRVEEERARLAAQVREQARQMEQILATVPTGVLLLDAEWRVLRANPTAKKDLVKLADIEVGDILTKLGDRPLAELLTSPPTQGLWHEIESDRDTFEVIARSMPTSISEETAEEDGASEQWVLVINDVTREREIRTQLQQQERLAAIGQMAAGIAHDFNNIMAVVVLYAQLGMRTPNLPPKIGDRLQIISQQAKRATGLIEQILDFSRRAMLERRPLDLLPLLKEQVKLLERTLPEHIEIELDCAPAEYTIHADPTRIQQVIMNLAVNARDAMPEGGALRMSLEQITIAPDQAPPLLEMGSGTWHRLSVADTGSGIAPEILPHIFEPFFTTKGPGEGSGLGLPQVHGIVGLHGGYIDVKTEVGAGTTFIIYLPALREKPTEVTAENITEMPSGHGETILVVEDEEVVRAALVATLEQLDYRVLQASNGQEALTILALQADKISLVLSDFVMPVMGGRRLFAAMQKRGFDLPVVLLSGHPLEEELREMQDQGLADWMLKPPNIEQLAKVLAQALKDRAG